MLQRILRPLFAGLAVLALASQAIAADVSSIAGQVSQIQYSEYLGNSLYTYSGANRGIGGAEHDLARTNIYDTFASFGLNTYLDPFQYAGNTYNNVVGVHQGKAHPDQAYIVGAHYDSVANPGADDNASGTAGVMEAARVLSQYDFEATLIFIGFDREEQGLIGSTAYVNGHTTDDILGMISLDMIAYNSTGAGLDKARVYGQSGSDKVKNSLADAISTYTGITPVIGGPIPGSDHAPFESAGFQAALLIEYGWGSNPYYHRASDSINTANYIDFAYATSMTRGTVGYLAAAAGLMVPEPGSLACASAGSMWLVLITIIRRRAKARA